MIIIIKSQCLAHTVREKCESDKQCSSASGGSRGKIPAMAPQSPFILTIEFFFPAEEKIIVKE